MRKTYLLILFFLLPFAFFAQDRGYLEFAGRCVKDNVPLKGANISIFKGSTKVTELITPKNGKFQFFLDFKGVDYRVVFTYPGCPDMYLMIYSAKVNEDKEIFPIYDIEVNFFEFGKPTINYANFKNPFTKIIFDGKKSFQDDEAYAADFLQNLYIDVEAIKKRDEQLAADQHKKELEAKMKLEAEEKLRQQQLADAAKKSQEEADRLKKQFEEADRLKKLNEAKNNVVAKKEEEPEGSVVSKEVELTLDKEKRNQKEKQNKAIRATYENDLLKIVATNERTTKVAEYVKKKNDATRNEVIETLKKEAETKAMSEQVVFDSKVRNKQVLFNSQVRNQEMVSLIKVTAYNDRTNQYQSVKKFPETKNYKPPGLVAITSDVEHSNFKSAYSVTVTSGNQKNTYRKEKFPWGVTYYYKNDKAISEEQYIKELSPYNIAI
jgi:hypothetical protein